MMIRMLALQSFPYAGRRLIAGQRFDCRGESDARLLVALKRAMRDPAAAWENAPAQIVTNRAVITTTELEHRTDIAQQAEPLQNPDVVESGSGPLLETAGAELPEGLPDPNTPPEQLTPPEQTTEAAQVVEHPEGAEDGSGDAEGSSLPDEQAETGTPAAKKAKRTYTRRTTSPEKAE